MSSAINGLMEYRKKLNEARLLLVEALATLSSIPETKELVDKIDKALEELKV